VYSPVVIAAEQVRRKPDTAHFGWRARAFAAYAVAAAIFTWPLVLRPFSVLASTEGPGDSYLNLWILGWDLQSIVHHPASIFSGRVFDANIFHPAASTLAYSDHLLLQALALLPIYLLFGNLTFCYNVLFFASLIACALAMHAYVRELVGESPAAWVAGLAWGLAPYHFSHLIHLQLQALYFLPLTFLFLHRVLERGRKRDACLLGITLAAQALSSVYYGVIGALAVTGGAIILMLGGDRKRIGVTIRRLVLAAVIGTVVVGPVALKYWWVQRREGFGRSLHEASQGSAVLRAYLEVPAVNLLYARAGLLHPHNAADSLHKASEQNLFPGFVLFGLASIGAAIGVSAARGRESRAATVMFLALVVAGFLLSLGPDGVRPLYASLYRLVFGFQAIRAPARFAVLVLFGLAGLAALGVERLRKQSSESPGAGQGAPATKKGPGRGAPATMLILLLALEYLNSPIHYVPAPQIDTPAGRWLRAAQEPGAVVYLPLELDPSTNTIFMVQSLAHGRPIVNGYSGERPAFFTALVDTMARFPSAEAVKTLLDLKVRFLVSPAPVDAAALPAGTLVERARFSDSSAGAARVVYELHESAELVSALTLPETPPLPEPVSIPFAIGEKAIYSVVWTSGPLSLPAGQVTLEVRPRTNGAGFELAASGRTADWVSNFFEADDRFVSQVDDRLRSLTFEQHVKEGRRRLDRQMVFDRARGAVRVQQGSGPTISLPIPADALDPLAALYYARTLPLSSGSTVLIPINDSNRNLVVELSAPAEGAAESILHKGSRIEAVRTNAQIRRGQGALPAQIAIWFLKNAPNLPVKAEISGIVGVGDVRLELESAR
jgi:uncharacterized protein DUF3108